MSQSKIFKAYIQLSQFLFQLLMIIACLQNIDSAISSHFSDTRAAKELTAFDEQNRISYFSFPDYLHKYYIDYPVSVV